MVENHLHMGHTSLNSKRLSNYHPGQRTESPLSSLSGSFQPLGSVAVLSGGGPKEGSFPENNLNLNVLLAR